MSFDANSIAIAAAAADVDHRKKRRNRTTHSCINCHTTKRKCDRKRPCGRCTQLGLTGLCVYEVDDPSTADDPNIDETSKLRKRIAELEGVIRELKNKPHPKWAQTHGPAGDLSFHTRSQNAKRRRMSDDDDDEYDGMDNAGPSGLVKLEHGFNAGTPYTLPDSFRLPSEANYHGDSAHPMPCECLTHSATYQSLANLESYLRSASEVLNGVRHSPLNESGPASPTTPSDRCVLVEQISRLQDLISHSTSQPTRGLPVLPSLPTIRHPASSPMPNGGPLRVQVPMAFHQSISHTVPSGFNLRPPPPPPSSSSPYPGHPAPSYAGRCDSGLITPPSSTGSMSHAWDGPGPSATSAPSPHLPSSYTPRPLVASPALSNASGASRSSSETYSHGSNSSGGPLPSLAMPVPDCLAREAVSSLVGMHSMQQPQPPQYSPFFGQGPPTASSVPFDYDVTPSSAVTPQSAFDFALPYPVRAQAY